MGLTTAQALELARVANPEVGDAIRRQLAASSPPKPAATKAGPKGAGPNKLEQAYGRHLDALKAAGVVRWWAFNAVRLCIASGEKRAFYKPDFAVKFSDGRTEYHETKGFWREAARLRIKVAAGLFPYAFVAVRWVGGEWAYERFGGNERKEGEA